MRYAVKIEKDGDGYMAFFPDVPEAVTGGDNYEETLELASDSLKAALVGYMEMRRAVPMPKTAIEKGGTGVSLPEIMQAKVLLWNEILAHGLSKTEFARRLGKTERFVRRLLNPYENVTIKTLADAARALECRMLSTNRVVRF